MEDAACAWPYQERSCEISPDNVRTRRWSKSLASGGAWTLGLLEDDRPKLLGDWVLIHVGYAMSKISVKDAMELMRTLDVLGETEAALQEVRGYGLPGEESLNPNGSAPIQQPPASPSGASERS